MTRSACSPSPCGPYSECTVNANGAAACSCRAGHIGSPPSCRPECLVSSECKLQLACIDRRCRDPCEGACGRGAKCQVIAHSPICTCNDGYTGDPFTYCYPAPGKVSFLLNKIFLFFNEAVKYITMFKLLQQLPFRPLIRVSHRHVDRILSASTLERHLRVVVNLAISESLQIAVRNAL